ncbi:cell filamentation protein Fic [Photorhabdus temperata]|uniref:protein adenylyltransferase n=2 Tax=Photorhabdus khanii TaxID=1004150 RepID=W3VBT3_9GAMM|nr:putative adenosine monophosphate-protein transferase Fic [Photorhabdus khanii]ETS33391.1 protein involved in cell division [Photorhabdus khanii NC19]MQL47737.1 putative adenosine monophosphate-protein transferase Fic [Photorhabdus khanii]OHV53903.1 cell filamentation protein Fic [Photorhabdus temperata]
MVDKYGAGQDPYTYPDTDTLINKLGIRDSVVLEQAERELTELAILNISFQEPPYDLAFWCYLHKQIFSDLYDWSGQLRTIDISKGNTRFCHAKRIETEGSKIFNMLDCENFLIGLNHHKLIKKLAEYYAELNAIHPFREGNGRTQRLLFEYIVINCGYNISFASVDAKQWIEANISAYQCNYQPLMKIFGNCVS